jgi:hypothetical protein
MKTTRNGSLLRQHSVCCSKTCSFSVRGHSHLLTKQLHPVHRARQALVLFSFETWICKRSSESHASMARYHRRMRQHPLCWTWITVIVSYLTYRRHRFQLVKHGVKLSSVVLHTPQFLMEELTRHSFRFSQLCSFCLLMLQPPFNIHQIANGTDILQLSFAMLEPSSYPIIRLLMVKSYIS